MRNGDENELPHTIEAYLALHEIAVKETKIKKQSIYFKDTNGVLYRYFKRTGKLIEFINNDWYTLIEEPRTDSISLF